MPRPEEPRAETLSGVAARPPAEGSAQPAPSIPGFGTSGTVGETSPPQHLFADGGRVTLTFPPHAIPLPDDLPDAVDPVRTAAHRQHLNDLIDRSLADDSRPLADGYSLVRKIGAGTFGTVWEAEHRDTGERVAIKFFAAGDGHWQAMLEEVKLLQSVEGSQGIVMVKLVRRGQGERPPYYVMSLARHGSLARRLAEARGRAAREPVGRRPAPVLPVAEAVRLFTRVVEALAFVHRRGIHHCDLKPANILLSETDEPLIADFGQAHLGTDASPALGTFFYMAPDQATLGRTLPDTRWDVYALGAVLYEMLVGEPPRKADALIAGLRGTVHLDGRLKVYREGIAAAPPPTAHRRLADNLLAKVIDRCLAVDPNDRPRDAGELLALLRRRAWWRRTRPVLTLGTVATVALVFVVAGVSLFAARRMYEDSRSNITREIQGSLSRDAWYGRQIIEGVFEDHVGFAEREADACPPAVRSAMVAAADRVRKAGYDPKAAGDRKPFQQWLADVHAGHVARGGEPRSLAVVLAVDGRGFFLARLDGQGKPEDPARASNPAVYTDDWSFRDYFHGAGNRFDARGQPHDPVRTTHISQTYQSTADNKPWKVDISTPVFDGPDRTGRVAALFLSGVDLRGDLVGKVAIPDSRFTDESGIARAVDEVIVNDRGHWVWHEAAMARLEAAKLRNPAAGPDCYTALAGTFAGGDGERRGWALPWHGADASGRTDSYIDLIQWDLDGRPGDPKPQIAFFERVHPYRASRYPDLRGRPWAYVVQVDAGTALKPVEDLRRKLLVAGSVLVLTLAGLAAGLWGWLIRVLRGREFTAHG